MSVSYFGDFAEDDTIIIPFNTFSSDDPSASVTITNLVDTDVWIYKDASDTQYAADACVNLSLNHDSITGSHLCSIDTSENVYFVTGSEYAVRIVGTTVDGGTIEAWIGAFSIERAGGVLALLKTINIANGAVEADLTYMHGTALTETAGQLAAGFKKCFDVATPLLDSSENYPTVTELEARTIVSADYVVVGDTIAGVTSIPDVTLADGAHGGASAAITLSDYSDFTGAAASNPNVLQAGTITVTTQTSFTLSAGSADDDAYLNMVIVFEDTATATQKSVRTITAYTGATKTVTIDSAPDFTIVSTDKFNILAVAPGSTPPTVGQIRTEMDDNSTQLALIVADTDELQTNQGNWITATGFATPTNITAGTITTVTTLTGHTPQTADHTAGIADIPTMAEFEARTIVAADYVITSDTIAGATLVDTVTTLTGHTAQTADHTASMTAIKAVTDALTAAAAAKLSTSAGVMVIGTVSHDITAASTTVFYCDDITEATADHFNGRIVIFTSGALQYQATDITDYALVSGEGQFTCTALTEAPADNTQFIIV